jgi:hypothetical protein
MLYCNALFYVMQSKLLGFPKECECMFGYWKNWLLLPVYSEGQQIKTNQTNILIRSLQLNKHKGDSSSKDVKGLTATEGSRKRYCFYLTGTGCFTCFEKICLLSPISIIRLCCNHKFVFQCRKAFMLQSRPVPVVYSDPHEHLFLCLFFSCS